MKSYQRGAEKPASNTAWVAPTADAIRKVVIATGAVTTLAGSPGESGSTDGAGAAARFYWPEGVASDGAGNLFVADYFNDTIRKVVIATGAVTTLAGSPRNPSSADGTGADARFSSPSSMASDGAGNLFVVDEYNHTIRKVVVATGVVTTVVGSPGRVGVTFEPLPAGLNLRQGLAGARENSTSLTTTPCSSPNHDGACANFPTSSC